MQRCVVYATAFEVMAHEFGNIDSWTKEKLERVKEYLNRYLVALKNQDFRLEYIDAFAGTGYVTGKFTVPAQTLFDTEETISLKNFIDGSARVALQTSPPFSQYIFIERHQTRFQELARLRKEFPKLASSIKLVNAEANGYVQRMCRDNWISARRRAVMFLDPYGTQVTWETIKAIAETRAIDLWILFPIGTVNRLLNRNGRIIEGRKQRLNMLFGEEGWFETFYQIQERRVLFTNEVEERYVKRASFETIAEYFVRRLATVFEAVAPNPLLLKNSANSPIFLLCFAAGNPAGASIAVRIAQHILGKK